VAEPRPGGSQPPAGGWQSRSAVEWEAELLERGTPAAVVAEDLAALPPRARAGLRAAAGGACELPAAPWSFEA